MNRETLIVTEKKEKIEEIKKKYNNLKMNDNDAKKIISLEVTNSILKMATKMVGVITIIDYFVPDPLFGLDEVALTAITSLLGGITVFVDNKIEVISRQEDASIKIEEVNKLGAQLGEVIKKVDKSRKSFK